MSWKSTVCAIVGHKWQRRRTGEICARCPAFRAYDSHYSTTLHWDGVFENDSWDGNGWRPRT